jgi:hypothetical protein
MAERRKAADDAEVAFYNEQIEDVKGTLETAKQMEAAASRGAARLEKRAATIEASPATPSKSGGDAASRRRQKSRNQASSAPIHATNRNSATTPESMMLDAVRRRRRIVRPWFFFTCCSGGSHVSNRIRTSAVNRAMQFPRMIAS